MNENQKEGSNKDKDFPESATPQFTSMNPKMIQPELFPDLFPSKNPLENEAHGDVLEFNKIGEKDRSSYEENRRENGNESPIIDEAEKEERSIGQMLADSRKRLNLSRDEVSRENNLPGEFLKYLEADDYSNLPAAAVYVKSYIKSLCRIYKLDPERILQRYRGELNQPELIPKHFEDSGKQASSFFVQDKRQKNPKSPGSLALVFSWIIFFIVILIVIIIMVYAIGNESWFKKWGISRNFESGVAITDSDLEQLIHKEYYPFKELPQPTQDRNH